MIVSKYLSSENYENGYIHYYSYGNVCYRAFTYQPFSSLSDEHKLFLQEQNTITGVLRDRKTSGLDKARLIQEAKEYFEAIRYESEEQFQAV